MQQVLAGYRVIDLGQVWAGPLVATQLADMGAEVIKVESRKRLDNMRMTPDNVARDIDMDPWFHSANRNKLSITLDFTEPRGNALLKRLIAISDVVVENFRPGTLSKHGLDYESLRELRPDIVLISLPGAGSTGPLSGISTYAPTIHALSGLDAMVGYEGEDALGIHHGYGDANSVLHGALAVLVALIDRNQTGEGQHIELAQWETAVGTLGEAVMEYALNGRSLGTQGNRHPTMAPHGNYPSKGDDKWISIAVGSEDEWEGFCRATGNPAWASEPRFADAYHRLQNRLELDKLVAAWTCQYSHYEATEILQAEGVAAFPLLDSEERFYDPHFQQREIYSVVEHPKVGTTWAVSLPSRLSRTPGSVRTPAPLLGEHNDHVFRELLGLSEAEIEELVSDKVLF